MSSPVTPRAPRHPKNPRLFILDVDGVMTDGSAYYTAEGKVMKRFGADDHDGLSLLKRFMEIRFVSGDKRGFEISKKRITDDMHFPLDLVSTTRRNEWIAQNCAPEDVVYMGDGIFDGLVFDAVGYAIAPANASPLAIERADFVTSRTGGDRAVAEACLHLMEKFFEPFSLDSLPKLGIEMSGAWKA